MNVINKCLEYIPVSYCENRGGWLRVGCLIKNMGGDVEQWLNWSSTYKNFRQRAATVLWNSVVSFESPERSCLRLVEIGRDYGMDIKDVLEYLPEPNEMNEIVVI